MRVLLLLALGFSIVSPIYSAVWYVSATGSGLQNGTSWSNAYPADSLQVAVQYTNNGDEVWVACGTYFPTTTSNRNISFSMKNNVSILGGFQGTETSLSQRDLSCGSCSVLSGEIATINTNDNSYTVVSNIDLDSSAILDGFVITGGNDDRTPTSFGDGLGGGIYNHGFGATGYCNPTIKNCILHHNSASWGGGAFNNAYNQGTSLPTYIRCVFHHNHGYVEAGGMDTYAVRGNGRPLIISCLFYENTGATNVGAMYAWGGNTGGNCHPVIINSAFINNHALNGYGGAFISDNLDETGGASSGNATVTLYNTIVWGNTATGAGQQFYVRGTGSRVIAHHCNIDTSSQPFPSVLDASSTNILSTDPLFQNIANAVGSDSCWFSSDDGLILTSSSPCIDAGNNSYDTSSLDITFNSRISGATIDIGPYEYAHTTTIPQLEKNSITLYPNPTSQFVNLLSNINVTPLNISIYNVEGQLISSQQISTNRIDLSDFRQGIYFIRIFEETYKVVLLK